MWERTQERLKEIPLIHAEKSPGVDPKAWPQSGLQEALYATGFARLFWNIHQNDPLYADLPPERRTVAELPWIGEVEKRDQNGYFRAHLSQGLSHHYGCLYAHLYQWQKIKDTGLKKALILESDGLSLTRVPLSPSRPSRNKCPATRTLSRCSCIRTNHARRGTTQRRNQTPNFRRAQNILLRQTQLPSATRLRRFSLVHRHGHVRRENPALFSFTRRGHDPGTF